MATKEPAIEVVTMVRGCEARVVWFSLTRPVGMGAAFRSPLTGGWLVDLGSVSLRVPRLKDARRAALGGNGRRYGGHTGVAHVVKVQAPVA